MGSTPTNSKFEEFLWTHKDEIQYLYRDCKTMEIKIKSSPSDLRSQKNEFGDYTRCKQMAMNIHNQQMKI